MFNITIKQIRPVQPLKVIIECLIITFRIIPCVSCCILQDWLVRGSNT